jgi:hypothetical protein
MAWFDSSCWDAVIIELEEMGSTVAAVELPLSGFDACWYKHVRGRIKVTSFFIEDNGGFSWASSPYRWRCPRVPGFRLPPFRAFRTASRLFQGGVPQRLRRAYCSVRPVSKGFRPRPSFGSCATRSPSRVQIQRPLRWHLDVSRNRRRPEFLRPLSDRPFGRSIRRDSRP